MRELVALQSLQKRTLPAADHRSRPESPSALKDKAPA